MPDMLVPLYRPNNWDEALKACAAKGITIRPALAPERRIVVEWVAERWGDGWAGETETGFSSTPPRVLVAVKEGALLGFACHDVTARGFFGPTGVDETQRKQGIGTALLFATLGAMKVRGYAYAIIGAAGPVAFYERMVAAIPIPSSEPGIYAGLVKPER